MPVLESKLDTRSEVFQQNLSDMHERLSQLQELYDEAAQGGGEEAMARLKSRNKMPIRERIAHVLDRDAPFLEISPLAAWRSPYAIGSGFVVGIGSTDAVDTRMATPAQKKPPSVTDATVRAAPAQPSNS